MNNFKNRNIRICQFHKGNKNILLKYPEEYIWEDKNLGFFRLPVNYSDGKFYFAHCSNCKNEIIGLDLLEEIEKIEQKRIEQLLLHSVGDDLQEFNNHLLTKAEASKICGLSLYAQNRKSACLNTLVYFVTLHGTRYWWKESIIQYIQTGDGRFSLKNWFKY